MQRELENTKSRDIKKIISQNKEDMYKIWEKRDNINEEGKVKMEQWLSHEERRAKNLIMRREQEGRGIDHF